MSDMADSLAMAVEAFLGERKRALPPFSKLHRQEVHIRLARLKPSIARRKGEELLKQQ